MRDAPIGVFDSGVGGLTVLRELVDALPREDFIYLGDTARLPYGTKSAETVARYAVQAADALLDYGVKLMVVACNTASAVGLPAIRNRAEDTPVVGVIEPGAAAACATTRSGHVAVIATEGTVRGGAYQEAILRRRPDARITAVQAQLFVALAEEGLNEGLIAEDVARHYLGPVFGGPASGESASEQPLAGTPGHAELPLDRSTPRDARSTPDTLVLGCTHFPMLLQAIRVTIDPRVSIVDSAVTTAHSVAAELVSSGLARGSEAAGEPLRTGAIRFLATDSTERFARVGSRFLRRDIAPETVQLIDL